MAETFNFTCTAHGGPTLEYTWKETIGGVTTPITPETVGKIANGNVLTITAQSTVSSPIEVNCSVKHLDPQFLNNAAQEASGSYIVKGEHSCFF